MAYPQVLDRLVLVTTVLEGSFTVPEWNFLRF
jgi:hypothetical protein